MRDVFCSTVLSSPLSVICSHKLFLYILIEFSKSLGMNILTVATDSYNGHGWKKRFRFCYKTGRFYYLGEGWDGINGQSFLVSSQAIEG